MTDEKFIPKKLGIEDTLTDEITKHRKRGITFYLTQPFTLEKARRIVRDFRKKGP